VPPAVIETVDFLLRDMKVGDAFAASISSGSQNEDAKYYTWSEAEIDAAWWAPSRPASSRSTASPATATCWAATCRSGWATRARQ
jgi:hypothetical protein